MAVRRRQRQRGSGRWQRGSGVGARNRPQLGSEGGKGGSQPKRRVRRFLIRRAKQYALCSIAEQKQLSVVSARCARTT